jgi:putative PIN family toxin of toxin-antitoxin system
VRIVLDTNILIGAWITRGTPPDQLYRTWHHGTIELVTSDAQVQELAAVLGRPRIRKYVDPDAASAMIGHIDPRAVVVEDLPELAISPDPEDNPILATAIAGRADPIVSGDKNHLLAHRQSNRSVSRLKPPPRSGRLRGGCAPKVDG